MGQPATIRGTRARARTALESGDSILRIGHPRKRLVAHSIPDDFLDFREERIFHGLTRLSQLEAIFRDFLASVSRRAA